MRIKLRLIHVLGLACVVAVVGCSSGTTLGPVSTGSESASGQVASGLFVQQWGQLLWGLVANQTGTQTPSFGPPVWNPDGSVSRTFTGADGTEAVITGYGDGSIRLEITYPDGTWQTAVQSPPQFDGISKTTTDWEVSDSTGLSVTYTTVVDDKGTLINPGIEDDTTEVQGTSVLPDGQTQQFHVFTDNETGVTTLQSQQSDGSSFSLWVPLETEDYILPDFSQPAGGTYSGPGFDTHFTLESTPAFPSRWARLVSDFGEGITGEFSLNADFSGSGRLLEDGEVMALLSWSRTGETRLSFLTGDSGAVSPAGAAVDYLTHRWQTLQALLAPAPG